MIDVSDTLRIPAGTRLELQDGSVVEVLENPGDGVWLLPLPVLAGRHGRAR